MRPGRDRQRKPDPKEPGDEPEVGPDVTEAPLRASEKSTMTRLTSA